MRPVALAFRRPILQLGVFGLLTLYFLSLCIYFSSHRMMWADEFDGWNLITDSSLHHMIGSWNLGADGGGVLFYGLGRLIVSVTGKHILAIRLFSAICLWGAAVLWWRILRQSFSDFPAFIAVLLIWFCDPIFVYQIAEARFYGLLILSTVVAVNTTVWVQNRQPSASIIFLVCFLANGLLVSSHYLGLIYSAILLIALFFSKLPRAKHLAALAGTLSSWLLFLIYLRPIRSGGSNNVGWIMMPTVINTLRYYFHAPTVGRFFNLSVFIFMISCIVFCLKRLPQLLPERSSRTILLLISAFFLLIPVGFYVISHLYHPLSVARYMMPYSLGFCCMFACALWILEQQAVLKDRPGLRLSFQVALVCAVVALHFIGVRQQPVRPLSDIQPLIDMSNSLPLVISNDTVFYEMRYYGGPAGANTFFPIPSTQSGYLGLLSRRGYAPGVVADAEFLGKNRQFLYLDFPDYRDFYQRAIADDPRWLTQDVGVVRVQGLPIHLLRVEQR
jgi:hypothetical protein